MKSFLLAIGALLILQASYSQKYKKLDDLTENFVVLLNEGHDFPAFKHLLITRDEALETLQKNVKDQENLEKIKKEIDEDFDERIYKKNLSRWESLKSSIGRKVLTYQKTEFQVDEKSQKMLGIEAGQVYIYVESEGKEFRILIDKVFKMGNSWRINEIGSRLIPMDGSENTFLEEVEEQSSEISEEATEEMAEEVVIEEGTLNLPNQFRSLIGKWKFEQVIADGKDVTEIFLEGKLDGEKYTMEILESGKLVYSQKYKEANSITNSFWEYLGEEYRREDEPNIDFVIENYNTHGGNGKEKYTLVKVNDEVLQYKNEALDINFFFKRVK